MNIGLVDAYKKCFNKSYILEAPKRIKVPKRIVTSYKRNGFLNYRMYERNGELVGTMQAIPECVDTPDFYPATKCYYSFYIKDLKALKRNSGVGSSFMKLAQKESYRNCCDGKVHLIAQNPQSIRDKPDIFYRKCGFDSQEKDHIEEIDECIKSHKPLEILWLNTLMYLPIKKK